MSKSDINFVRSEVSNSVDKWTKIRNICEHKDVAQYIHKLNSHDRSPENSSRNEIFKKRAVFNAVAAYTTRGFLGLIFDTPPQLDVPTELEYVAKNVDGSGISIQQQSQAVVKSVLYTGRCGLWADFPKNSKELSVADLKSGNLFATIKSFPATSIINWRTKTKGSRVVLSLVVIQTTEDVEKINSYEISQRDIILELFLGEEHDIYGVRKYIKADKAGREEWVQDGEDSYPTSSSGEALDFIPFTFIGSESNTWNIDSAPMFDIAQLNLAHYNNSAIYEDSVFTCGQAQPWMSGLDQSTLDIMKENNMYIGSGRMIGVPSGEKFGFEQPDENPLAKEAMDSKLEQMIGLGAMFISPGSAVKTAQQSGGEQKSQQSTLSLIAGNVSEAYQLALSWCGVFMNVSPEADIVFELNQDYKVVGSDPQMLREMISGFLQGAIPAADYQNFLKKHDLTPDDQPFEEFNEQINVIPETSDGVFE